MTGDINVAVAEFGEIDAQGRTIRSPAAAGLATSVWKEMDDELNALTGSVGDAFIVEVRPPDQVRRIGARRRASAERAEKLADDINADVVVYGNLKSGAETDDFVPEFWVSVRQLSDAEEVRGQYGYGSALQDLGDVDGNPVARSSCASGW